MTELLYYINGYLAVFNATVIEKTQYQGKPALVLDKTAFFPEGGGQPGDTGTIGNANITDTQIGNGIVYHILKDKTDLSVGDTVNCEIDFQTRFARMQAHTGEHIVSGIAYTLYGVNNVGFHMDGTVMTVDFDRPLSKEQLTVLERKANECVYKNAQVKAWYPEKEALQELFYRSKTEILDRTRIVTIEGYDQCACCAVHVAATGEVGLIKILTAVSHRGGVRLTLICGITAYTDYCMKHEHTLRIAELLAAKHAETDAAVEKLLQKEKDLSYRLQKKTDLLIQYVKNNTVYTENNRVYCFDGMDPQDLKNASVQLKDSCGGLCVAISGDDCKGYYFSISSVTVNVKDFTKMITTSLNGSGGGRFDVVQGRFNATKTQIENYFSELKVI